MKQAMSITIDLECAIWLESRKDKRSRVVNRLIQSAMAGEKDQIKHLQDEIKEMEEYRDGWYKMAVQAKKELRDYKAEVAQSISEIIAGDEE